MRGFFVFLYFRLNCGILYLYLFNRINSGLKTDFSKRKSKGGKKHEKDGLQKEYDTETMTVVKKAAHGAYGDPAGYEEVLYVAADGKYFLYGVGGETSPYPQEKLVSLAKAKAAAWEKENA